MMLEMVYFVKKENVITHPKAKDIIMNCCCLDENRKIGCIEGIMFVCIEYCW